MHATIDFPGLSEWLIHHGDVKVTADALQSDEDSRHMALKALNDLNRLVNNRSEKEIGCALRQIGSIARSAREGNHAHPTGLWPADTD